MGIVWWGMWVWGQLSLAAEGGVGGIHRIPVVRTPSWREPFLHKKGEVRYPGPYGWAGLFLRYFSSPKAFLEVGFGLRGFTLRADSLRETHLLANLPVRGGIRLKAKEKPWWLWIGISSSFQLRATSQPPAVGIYRFADYFARSQLHVHAGGEKAFSARWQAGVSVGWDLSSAWDRGLFRSYRSLPHHLWVYPYLRYRLWAERG